MLVWLAVDEPGTVDDLVYRLAESGIERTTRQLTDAIAALTSTGWLTDY